MNVNQCNTSVCLINASLSDELCDYSTKREAGKQDWLENICQLAELFFTLFL